MHKQFRYIILATTMAISVDAAEHDMITMSRKELAENYVSKTELERRFEMARKILTDKIEQEFGQQIQRDQQELDALQAVSAARLQSQANPANSTSSTNPAGFLDQQSATDDSSESGDDDTSAINEEKRKESTITPTKVILSGAVVAAIALIYEHRAKIGKSLKASCIVM